MGHQFSSNPIPPVKPDLDPYGRKPLSTKRAVTVALTVSIAMCSIGITGAVAAKNFKSKALLGKGSSQSTPLFQTETQHLTAALNQMTGETSGITTFTGPDSTPSLVVAPTAEPRILQQKSSPAPSLQQTAGMPSEIRDWLEHLRRIDEAKTRLAEAEIQSLIVSMGQIQARKLKDQMAGLMGDDSGFEENNSTNMGELNSATTKIQREWNDLQSQFIAKPAPDECRFIATSYNQAIIETGAMVLEVVTALELAASNPEQALESLTNMRGSSSDRIDQSTTRADSGVERICQKYKVTKWFSLKSDTGSGVMQMISGLGM